MAFRCPASVRNGEGAVRLNETNEMARTGSAAHELFRMLPERGRIDFDAIPEIAIRWEVEPDELRVLAAKATKLWRDVKSHFWDALGEVPLSAEILPGVMLTGNADLVKKSGRVARGADWKAGRLDSDYSAQMKAYGALILLDDRELQEVTFTLLWVRDETIENYTLTRASMREWVGELIEKVIHWNGVFRPGTHCQYCPRGHECPARNALVRKTVADVANLDLDSVFADLATMPAARMIEIVEKAKLVAQVAEKLRGYIREHVIKNGDVVSSTHKLTIEKTNKRHLALAGTFPILTAEGFGDEDFEECAKLSPSAAEKIIAERAGKGNGARAVREFREKLEAAQAVTLKEEKKLVVRRV